MADVTGALGTRTPLSIPRGANQRWSLDFLSDAFADGRRFRILAVVDDFNLTPTVYANRSAPEPQRGGTLRYAEGSRPAPLLHRALWAHIQSRLFPLLDEARGSDQDHASRYPLILEAAHNIRIGSFVLDGEVALLGVDDGSDFGRLDAVPLLKDETWLCLAAAGRCTPDSPMDTA